MIPIDVEPRLLEFPAHGEPTIVLATGDELRHQRFALRMQQEFGRQVIAWFQFASPARATPPAPSLSRRARLVAKRILRGPPAPPSKSIFAAEVEQLRHHAVVDPRIIARDAIHGDAFVRDLTALRPFFFLTLGGGLYGAEVLAAVRGVAINQHAGYSPEYRGNQTIMQALYHRDLSRVAATVHLTTSGADAGPMLRRSNPCLTPADSVATVIDRVVALGTELMIECVAEISVNRRILAFDQPLAGRTYLARDCDDHVRGAVRSDFERGWLPQAMARRKSW